MVVAAKMLLMGNEAIARGAVEAGVQVVTGYPGLPFSPEGLLEVVLKTVPSQFRETNRKAFEMGRRVMGVC